jgi:hypothetical protein
MFRYDTECAEGIAQQRNRQDLSVIFYNWLQPFNVGLIYCM